MPRETLTLDQQIAAEYSVYRKSSRARDRHFKAVDQWDAEVNQMPA
jgi:hypothetical protein